ncbi:MAG: heme exporter protein CcmB [Acidobacteriota bacterium]
MSWRAWCGEVGAVWRKEWRCELRTRYALNTAGLFALTTLTAVSIALGPLGTSEMARPVLPVLLWLILFFAAAAGLPRSFVNEEEAGTAIALRLTARPSSLFCGKVLYNLTLLFALEAITAPLFVTLFQMPVADAGRFAVALLAGGYGLALASTLVASMVAQARARGPLFSVLAFPVLLPLLLFAMRLTLAAVEGAPGAAGADDTYLALLRLLLAYNGTLTVAALMLFPAIWNP